MGRQQFTTVNVAIEVKQDEVLTRQNLAIPVVDLAPGGIHIIEIFAPVGKVSKIVDVGWDIPAVGGTGEHYMLVCLSDGQYNNKLYQMSQASNAMLLYQYGDPTYCGAVNPVPSTAIGVCRGVEFDSNTPIKFHYRNDTDAAISTTVSIDLVTIDRKVVS